MRNFVLLNAAAAILFFSGCNAGELELMKSQVAELKSEINELKSANAALQSELSDANLKLAKFEAVQQERTQQMDAIKQLMPNAKDLGEIMDTAKGLGLPELKDFNKEEYLKDAEQRLQKATEGK